MRLFTAIDFPPRVKTLLNTFSKSLQAQGVVGNFTRSNNLHLTLAFLGETPQTAAIQQVMSGISTPAFSLTLCGLGRFRRRGGDILWVGLEKDSGFSQLQSLQQELQQALKPLGFPPDTRPYNPHITLGRKIHLPSNFSFSQAEQSLGSIAFSVPSIHLVRSYFVDGILTYTSLFEQTLL